MRQLRIFRIFLATLFFVATVAYLFIGPQVQPMAVVSEKVQIILSAGTTAIGATLVWLVLTVLFGRIYCSTVCPVGTLSDIFIALRRKIPRFNRPFSFRKPKRWSIHVLIIYIICLLIGLLVVPYVIEPWNIMRNIASAVRPDAVQATWINLGIGIATAIAAGIVSLILLAVYALMSGRGFCTDVCPLGTAMGLLDRHTLYHIEINPDLCTSCGACEDSCKSQCISVANRLVDNTRCVRCFDCLAVCNDNAINFQSNKNTPATPLFNGTKQPSPNS